MRRSIGPALLLLIAAGLASAQVPTRREQFIYSVLAFNGRSYAGTFTTEDADAIYLVAGSESFLNARKTLVYYWPLTGNWMTDSEALNIPFEGKLELLGPGHRSRVLSPERFTFFNVRGEYELNWKVARGAEAEEAYKAYQAKVDAYWKSMNQYYEARKVYETLIEEMGRRITRLREAGQDVKALVDRLQNLPPPQPPEPPRDYVTPPSEVQAAFILDLPVGEYRIRFLLDGKVMEGSEKRLVVFDRRRRDGVGLEVIPADKWTRPVESQTPASVLYVDGTADLYLQPFFQDEFNDLYYEKLQRNDAKGNPALVKWVRMQQVPAAQLRLARPGGGTEEVREEPFFVEQVKGASLGYKIVAYDPQGAHKGQEPSLRAFHVPIRRENGVVRVQVQDRQGSFLKGGERQIRVLVKSRLQGLLVLLAILPLFAMGVVMARRARRTAR